MNAKEIRKNNKKVGLSNLKKHYFMFCIVMVVSVVLGTEFANTDFTLRDTTQRVIFSEHDVYKELKTKDANEVKQEYINKINEEKEKHEDSILSRDDGIAAKIVNTLSTNNIFVTISLAFGKIFGSTSLGVIIMIIVSIVLIFIFWFYFINNFKVISRRMFLEGRVYDNIPTQRFLYLFRIKKVTNTAYACFRCTMYKILWSLTIVGFFTKNYAYRLVPFILAENPQIDGKTAIKLSEDMMYGHKMELFINDISYFWWYVLSFFTFGFTEFLFLNPYRLATETEYYVQFRTEAKKKKIKNSELLNDKYLFARASKNVLKDTYSDVLSKLEDKDNIKESDMYTKIKLFFASNLGIDLLPSKISNDINNNQIKKVIYKNYSKESNGQSYPTRLFTIKAKDKLSNIEGINYLKPYPLTSLIIIFFSFALVGWIWEVMFHYITTGDIVNRGILHGPWVPIYGYGGLVILVLLYRFRKNQLLEFITAIILCGFIEYFTSYYLELTHDGVKWWDYTGYFLNLDGRICLEGLLLFGLGGMAAVYLIAPVIDNKIRRISKKIIVPLCTLLLILFIVDNIYSTNKPNTGEGVTVKLEELKK